MEQIQCKRANILLNALSANNFKYLFPKSGYFLSILINHPNIRNCNICCLYSCYEIKFRTINKNYDMFRVKGYTTCYSNYDYYDVENINLLEQYAYKIYDNVDDVINDIHEFSTINIKKI